MRRRGEAGRGGGGGQGSRVRARVSRWMEQGREGAFNRVWAMEREGVGEEEGRRSSTVGRIGFRIPVTPSRISLVAWMSFWTCG